MTDDANEPEEGTWPRGIGVDMDVPIETLVMWLLLGADPVAMVRGCPCHLMVTWRARRPFPPFLVTVPIPCRARRT